MALFEMVSRYSSTLLPHVQYCIYSIKRHSLSVSDAVFYSRTAFIRGRRLFQNHKSLGRGRERLGLVYQQSS